ncbi:Outer membrane protein beta-barrel domain-containing protein [Cnuella takakiae]|uniref:Outer membrane protein beta-barrel domain-containing protein n=1 Tax=Cnuella takakiae TaxID=1302690 RepID=A0A1M5H3F8_9BACT|nr:outer membrane beta-barrel protein [Cnuella takakiae]SHG10438.1 Outer membrane protein beta-barrel domain-containing protein [Cnuella takakiae]
MKRMITLLALGILLHQAASAQTEKGSSLIGGNLEVNTAKDNSSINVTPMVGYFFANNFAAGANIGLDYSKTGDVKSTGFGIGPFARYYFGTGMLRPLVQGNLNFTSYKTKTPTTSNSFTGTNYFLGGGAAAFLNRNVALEGLIGYDHTAFENQDGTGGLSLKIGFQVYLSRAQVAAATGR